ncbi:hypothetical protein AB0L50_34655, partial [Streptomyces flaveolus]|uniref:hypothetical protein n=1 Tax=Streptomyces flaveolus TaxID=67297 RepID=UPI0034350F61
MIRPLPPGRPAGFRGRALTGPKAAGVLPRGYGVGRRQLPGSLPRPFPHACVPVRTVRPTAS